MPAQIATTTGTFAQPIITAFRSGGSSVIFGMQPYINILTGTQAFPGASTPSSASTPAPTATKS